MSPTDPDISPLLPGDATLKARRAAFVEAVGGGGADRRPTPSGPRRLWRLALAGAVVVAVAIVALVLTAGDGGTNSIAFAVEPVAGGGETIKIYSPEDAAGLEAALAEAGIRSQVDWLPAGMACREPYFEKSSAKTASGESISGRGGAGRIEAKVAMEIGIMSSAQWQALEREGERGQEPAAGYFGPGAPDIVLEPASLGPGQSVVISGFRGPYGGDPGGGFEFHFAIAKGPVGACEPISLPGGGLLGLMNRQAKVSHATKAAGSGSSSPQGGVDGD
jgi:hypothetical protein